MTSLCFWITSMISPLSLSLTHIHTHAHSLRGWQLSADNNHWLKPEFSWEGKHKNTPALFPQQQPCRCRRTASIHCTLSVSCCLLLLLLLLVTEAEQYFFILIHRTVACSKSWIKLFSFPTPCLAPFHSNCQIVEIQLNYGECPPIYCLLRSSLSSTSALRKLSWSELLSAPEI